MRYTAHLGKGLTVWSSSSPIFLCGGAGEEEGEQGDEKGKKERKKGGEGAVVKRSECTLGH
jgi:hypothetical protein